MNESYLYTEIDDLQKEIAALHTGSRISLFDASSSLLPRATPEQTSMANNVFDRLSRPKLRYTSEVDSQGSITTEVFNELTFAPNTTKSKASYKSLHLREKKTNCRRVQSKRDQDVVARLMHAGNESVQNLRNKRIQQTLKQTVNCTFHPSLCDTSRKILSKKPYVPLSDLARQDMIRNKKLVGTEKLRLEQERAMNATFKPRKLARQKNFLVNGENHVPIYERNYISSHRVQTKQNWLCQEEIESSFKPVINERSRRIAVELFDYDNVHDKLHAIHEVTERRKELKRKENIPDFRPKINNLSKMLARKQVTIEKPPVKNSSNSECTFAPTINSLSRLLAEGNRKSIFKTEPTLQSKKSEKQKEEQTFSFTPQINQNINVTDAKNYTNLGNPRLLSQRIYLQQNRKEKRIEKKKKELVKEKEREATFRPLITKLKKQSSIPVVVKGLSRYLARKDRAKQIAQEQQEYEDKVFFKNRIKSFKFGTLTTPKPFLLNRKPPKNLCYLEQ